MILYFGNKLGDKGLNPTLIDRLTEKLKNYPIISVSSYLNPYARMIHMILTLIRRRKEARIVLIDTYSTTNFWYAIIIGKLSGIFGIPYVPILHGGNLPVRYEKNKETFDKYLTKAIKIIVPSHYFKVYFQNKGFSTELIPNFIDFNESFFVARTTLSARILWLRAFHEIYDPIKMIEIFDLVLKKYPDAKLCMVGDDMDGSREKVLSLIEELGLEDNVTLKHKMKKEEWLEFAAGYDLFVNTSKLDNQPVTLIEANSLGLPVISSDSGGIPYMLANRKEALIVEQSDAHAYSTAIFEVLENPELANALIRNGKNSAEQYKWENIKPLWEIILEGSD